MSHPLLRLEGLSKYYSSGDNVVMALSDVSLSLSRGEFVVITGASGSGKTSLASVLGGILPFESGELYFKGRPCSHFDSADRELWRRDRISYISQSYGILPGCSVEENVACALRMTGAEPAFARERSGEILRSLGLWDMRRRPAGKLSSGQKQRLAIARALAKPADILIADEPTGNLDPENSIRVMELLAQASRQRLVILISHDFAEAESFATRHIALKDGRVVLDAALSPAPEADPAPETPKAGKSSLSAYAARMQISGRPVWSALILLFFALSAFGVFTFLGSFIISLDDTSTRIYDDSAFRNGQRERIVVMRQDYQPLSDEDMQALLSLEYTESLERWGFLCDINYAWREGVDFDYAYAVQSQGDKHDMVKFISSTVKMRSSAPFMRSVPLLPRGSGFLSGGRLPENAYEVVASGDASLLGSRISIYLNDGKNWSSSVKIPLEAEIVGVTDMGGGLYFHEDLGRAFNDYYTHQDASALMLYDKDLPDDAIRLSADMFVRAMRYENYSFELYDFSRPITAEDGSQSWETYEVKLICEENGNKDLGDSVHGSYLSGYMLLSPANFEKSVPDTHCEQASLYISDYAYTDRALELLRDMGYIALSPFREGSTAVSESLAQQREQSLSLFALALAAVLLLQYLVLRALFSAQNPIFVLLSNMGLVCRHARRSIFLQTLLFTAAAQLLAFGALCLCREAGLERIVALWRYLPPIYMLLLSGLHLAASLLSAAGIARAMQRQVFPDSRRDSDLDMEEAAI